MLCCVEMSHAKKTGQVVMLFCVEMSDATGSRTGCYAMLCRNESCNRKQEPFRSVNNHFCSLFLRSGIRMWARRFFAMD